MREHDATETGWARSGDSRATRVMEHMLWRVNRLRCMTPAEIGHRVSRALAIRAESWGISAPDPVPPPGFTHAPSHWINARAKVTAARYLAAADRIAAGRFEVFALRGVVLGSPPDWNRDPKTGVDAPLTFGKVLDYRDSRLVGDIRYLWELNRHSHLVTLAQAYALSGETRYFEVIRRHLESWFTACPCGMGPNWTSALEIALRLISWSVAWQLLGGMFSPLFDGADEAQFRGRWLESVFQHAQFIRGHHSLYSSANNHLIGEASGLYIAAVTWPNWPHTHEWLEEASTILEREVLAQNAPDGVNREQSVSYQQFELDLLLLPLLAARANGMAFSPAFKSRIEAMLGYFASIMDAGGNMPTAGDSDDSLVLRLAQDGGSCQYRSLLATGAILFRRGDFKAKAGNLDDKTRWLLGAEAEPVFRRLDSSGAQLPVRRAFPVGGYYVLGCDFETDEEIRMVADAGPLGYQSIAAHGHADALAFTLSVGAEEFFMDPGTCTYRTDGPWRQYFRGTSAHNTLRVDGKDQSEPGGSFIWLRKARAGCSHWSSTESVDVFEGWHDGYAQLPDPVVHRRRITLDKRSRSVLLEDTLQMAGTHAIELFFHCNERCRVEPVEEGYRIFGTEKSILLKLPRAEGAVTNVYQGSVSPVLGWISRRFDEKAPAPTIAWCARVTGKVLLRSEIVC
jgi:hypothetical protein